MSIKNIFNKNYSPLCNYANAIINDYHTSEDIVQSIFVQLWENNKLLQLQDPGPYLLKCVKYKCIDHLRKYNFEVDLSTDIYPDIESEHILEFSEEDIVPVFAFLTSQLPPRTRQVFLMSREKGMTYKEIAEELGISVRTVENQVGTALKKLRALLIKHHYLPSFIIYFEKFFSSN